MITKLKNFFLKYRLTIIITFEIFWIIVFLLEQLTSGGGSDIPQFIYVNF